MKTKQERYIEMLSLLENSTNEKDIHALTLIKELQMKTKFKNLKVGRNDPCPCESGKKYKKCCIK